MKNQAEIFAPPEEPTRGGEEFYSTPSLTNNIVGFLQTDGPTGPLELEDLRRAIGGRRVIGRYHAFECPFKDVKRPVKLVCKGPNRTLIIPPNALWVMHQELDRILVSGDYRQEPEQPASLKADNE